MPAWAAPLAIGAGSAAAGALFGEDDKWDMSPEQRRIYEIFMKQYETGEFGYSQAEKAEMMGKIKESLLGESQARIGSTQKSLQRRGMLSPGQMTGISTDIQSAYGKAYGGARGDIELASAAEGRRRKGELERALMGTSQGQFIPGDDSMYGDMGDMAGNMMYYHLMKKKKPDYGQPSYGRINAPSMW